MAKQNKTKKKVKIIDDFPNKSSFITYVICQSICGLTIVLSLFSFLLKRSESNEFLTHLTLCVTAMILTNIPIFMRRRFKIYIPPFLQIIIIVFIVLHFVFGEIFRFYDNSLLFDKILHTTSGVTIAICGFSLVNLLNESPNTHLKLSPFFVALFSFCFALAIGYLWEIFEYLMDSIIKTNMQRWQDGFVTVIVDGEEVLVQTYGRGSGLMDTMGDLIVNAIGAAIISITGFVMLKTKNPKIQALLISSFKNPEKHEKEAEDAKHFFQNKKEKSKKEKSAGNLSEFSEDGILNDNIINNNIPAGNITKDVSPANNIPENDTPN